MYNQSIRQIITNVPKWMHPSLQPSVNKEAPSPAILLAITWIGTDSYRKSDKDFQSQKGKSRASKACNSACNQNDCTTEVDGE